MLATQSIQITPFDRRLSRVVLELQDEVVGLVPSGMIANKLALAPRTVRHYLRRAENLGLVYRPRGERSGYSAIQGVICSLAFRDSIERDAREISRLDVQLVGELIACGHLLMATQFDLMVSARTIRRRLAKLERLGIVHRPDGERSGYAVAGNRAMKVYAVAAASHVRGEVDPFQLRCLREMRWRERISQAVQSKLLADYMEIPERTMRYYLRQMEGLKLLCRPHGAKAGYRLTDVGRALLDMMGDDDGTAN